MFTELTSEVGNAAVSQLIAIEDIYMFSVKYARGHMALLKLRFPKSVSGQHQMSAK